MKIAIYGICKNESKHIERFYNSCKDADEIVVVDTGSEDDSVILMKKMGISVFQENISPWRFDTARNRSLSHISDDIDLCISMDFDEVIEKDWRHMLEERYVVGHNCLYTLRKNGENGQAYDSMRSHSRNGWKWKYPVHEELERRMNNPCWSPILITHHQDKSKSREQYLPLIDLALTETPMSSRFRLYAVTERMNQGLYQEAYDIMRNVFKYAQWDIERAYTCHMASKICDSLGRTHESTEWLKDAVFFAPHWRESWFKVALRSFETGMYETAYQSARRALELHHRFRVNYSDQEAWGVMPYIIAAESAAMLDQRRIAGEYYQTGLLCYPSDKQIASSYARFCEALK